MVDEAHRTQYKDLVENMRKTLPNTNYIAFTGTPLLGVKRLTTEEELEMYDLLIAGKKLTKAEEQKVKLAAKNLFKKLTDNRKSLWVVDWYKDDMPREIVKNAMQSSLDADLPDAYDKESFQSKITLLLNHFIDMAIQGYGWISAA